MLDPMKAYAVWMWIFILCSMIGTATAQSVTIQSSPLPSQWSVQAHAYRATIDKCGGLSSLQTATGKELLCASGNVGICLMGPQGLLNLTPFQTPGQRTIEAGCAEGLLRYEFDETGLTLTADNFSTGVIQLIINFAPSFKAICDAQKTWSDSPVSGRTCSRASFFMKDGTGLKVEGLLGYWSSLEGAQFAQSALVPQARATYRLTPIKASETEMTAMNQCLQPWRCQNGLTLLSPRPWQVFQRQTRLQGSMLISGQLDRPCDRIEYRLTGRSLSKRLPGHWRHLPLEGTTRTFHAWEKVPAGGWYRLEVRALKDGQPVLSKVVEKVGIGEVFVGAGQSNSTNFGQFPTWQTSDMVAATDGVHWQRANDPQPGAHDHSALGSFWPAFGDAMAAKYKVPIGVAVTGHGGTSVEQWQPDGELHRYMMRRIDQLGKGGFRAVLWHQGESEVFLKTPPQRYYDDLKNLIVASKYEAGWDFPWFTSMTSYCNPGLLTDPAVRGVQQRIWDESVALPGPDTDTLTGDNRDFDGKGIHLSPKGLKAHGQMWAEKVSVYLDQELARQSEGHATGWRRLLGWRK